jgi:hypothetical protein
MDDEKPHSVRRALFYWAAALAVVFVIYVLSSGPVSYVAIRAGWKTTDDSRIAQFYSPLVWYMERYPEKQPLRSYLEWWHNRGIVDRNRRRERMEPSPNAGAQPAP